MTCAEIRMQIYGTNGMRIEEYPYIMPEFTADGKPRKGVLTLKVKPLKKNKKLVHLSFCSANGSQLMSTEANGYGKPYSMKMMTKLLTAIHDEKFVLINEYRKHYKA